MMVLRIGEADCMNQQKGTYITEVETVNNKKPMEVFREFPIVQQFMNKNDEDIDEWEVRIAFDAKDPILYDVMCCSVDDAAFKFAIKKVDGQKIILFKPKSFWFDADEHKKLEAAYEERLDFARKHTPDRVWYVQATRMLKG